MKKLFSPISILAICAFSNVQAQDIYPAGSYTTEWDGRDQSGRVAASGVYFVQMRAGAYVAVRKIALVR